MKTLIDIIEAVPVPGFKPSGPVSPKGPAKPAQPSRVRAQVMTPRGRTTTVRKPAAIRKPGYGFIKYLPPKQRTARNDRHDKHTKPARKPIKPVAFGKTITEMKSLTQIIDEA